MAITGNGSASKEQVAGMLQKLLHLRDDQMPHFMDATDAVAAAYCHFLQMSRPETDAKHYGSWERFCAQKCGQNKINKYLTRLYLVMNTIMYIKPIKLQ